MSPNVVIRRVGAIVLMGVCGLAAPRATRADAFTDFSNGQEGWEGPQGFGGTSFIDGSIGNPVPSYRTQFHDFGITFANSTNAGFVGDYTQAHSATIGIDVNTTLINFFGQNVSRDWILELRDYDNPPGGYPWVSVWYDMADISSADAGWRHFEVTINDTSATALPPGWGGYGAEDPNTFEPILPPGRTFTNVLAGIDEIAFTTYTPGFFFGDADFDVAIDNVRLTFTPEPATALLLGAAGVLFTRRRR